MIPLATACLAFMLLSAVNRGLLLGGDGLARARLHELWGRSTPRAYARLIDLRLNILDVTCTQARLAVSMAEHEVEAERQVLLQLLHQQVQTLGDDLSERWRAWSAAAALLPAAAPVAPLRASTLRLRPLRALAILDSLARPLLTPVLGVRLHLGLLRLGLARARRDFTTGAPPSRLVDVGADLAALARASVPAYEALLRAPAQPQVLGLQGSQPS